jgi:hypothetical protein
VFSFFVNIKVSLNEFSESRAMSTLKSLVQIAIDNEDESLVDVHPIVGRIAFLPSCDKTVEFLKAQLDVIVQRANPVLNVTLVEQPTGANFRTSGDSEFAGSSVWGLTMSEGVRNLVVRIDGESHENGMVVSAHFDSTFYSPGGCAFVVAVDLSVLNSFG